YAVALVSFLARMTGDRDLAEDLFQDVFLTVWRKRHKYGFPRPFKPWLYAIAVNVYRAKRRGYKPAFLPLSDEAAAGGNSPSDVAVATETAARVTHMIRTMPAQQRAVVALRVWDGLSYPQIAEVVGRSEATVRSHMSHGLARLRQAFAGELG